MAVVHPPLFLQAEKHPARATRALIAEMYDEGVMDALALKVTQRASGGANYSVDVAAGRCIVQGDNIDFQGNYMVTNAGVVNLVPSSVPSVGNTRIDSVVVQVRDDSEDSGTFDDARIYIKAGTPTTGSPSAPSLGNNEIRLADILITSATTVIADADITDRRMLAGNRDSPGVLKVVAGLGLSVNGWLSCDGSNVSRTTYARLFAAIGTTYGPGDGSTTFTLPNLRERVPVGRGGSGFAASAGSTGGAATHTLSTSEMPVHKHTGAPHVHSMAHNHPATAVNGNWGRGNTVEGGSGAYRGVIDSSSQPFTVDISNYTGNTGPASYTNDGTTGEAGGGSAHNNLQPYQVIAEYIIRT